MSSDFPPQLQLRLPPASTSFKRSFEESALSATRPSPSATHEVHTASSSARSFHNIVLPPAIQDVEMLSYLPTDAPNIQSSSSSTAASSPRPQPNDQLRLSLERYNAFDAEISELRRSHSVSPLQPRTITPPPTLPPLMLSDDQPDLAAAALPFLRPEHRTDATPASPHGTDATLGSSSHTRRSSRDDVHPRISDARPFRIDLHLDPGLQPTQRSQTSLLSSEDSPIHDSPENATWTQTTLPNNEPALSELEFTFIRDRLNSALEPLRSASPLVPGLVEPRSPLPIPSRQSRTTAPTLPPLRTQLQQSGAWDDRSYRMLLFGPSIAAANNHDREGRTSETLSDTNNNSSRSQSSYWNEATYGISERLNSSSIASNRDREPTSQDLPPTEPGNAASAALGLQLDPFQPQAAPMYEDLEVDPIPTSGPQRNPTQQLPSLSSESLGYMSSEEWFPMLRRRSAWRLLDSDEEERLSIDARRLRLLAERRDAPRTTRPGLTSTSLDAGDHTHPWLDFGERRRPLSNRSSASAPRPTLSETERHVPVSAPFDGVHVWEDTDSDPMSGHTESDVWTNAEHYPRSTRADISQRPERLSDDISIGYNAGQPSLTRSNTNTSTLAAFSRLRNRLYSTSTRFASSNSLVTENSSEFRRRIARQEWMERWTRLNDERAQSQSEARPPRSMPESDEPRRPELRINTSTSLDRRLFGGLESLEEARRASELDAFNFHGDNIFETSFPASRRAATLARPAWNDHPVRRPSSPSQPSLSRQAPGLSPPPGLGTDRYSRFFEYLHNYPDSSPIYPPPFNFGPVDAPHRASEEPAHRDTRDPQNDWFSRRRHSARPSQPHVNLWSEVDNPDFGIANAGRGAGLGLRTDPAAGLGERDAAGPGLRSSFDRHTRIDEPPRISPIRAISPYFIDVPPLPSPDLSEFFESVPHFQPHPPHPSHEERLAASRPVPELSSRVSRRRSPSPAVRGPQTRPRLDRPVMRSATGFENIDPELFAPGPYRNTFQSLRGRRDPDPQISQPPTIPPFPFEALGDREAPSSRRHHSLYAETFDGRPPSRQTRTDSETEPRSAFWRSRPAFYVRNEWESSSPSPVLPSDEHRHLPPANDLHNFLSRHVSARMERAEAAAAANVSRFNHAIEVLRGEGLSRRPSFDRPPGGGRASGDAPRERSSLDWLAAHHHHHQHVRPRRARARRIRPLGDYMRDEDFDESYESLLSLAAAIGDVKPRCTPEEVISRLETATYKDWVTQDCDKRCPICLDDYGPNDTVMKVGDCAHWLHKDCLHQWLKGANTCPVCRMVVHSPRLRHARQHSRGETSTNNSPNDGNGLPTQNSASNLSTNTETPNSFSARPRPFGGWPNPSWRYHHP
ncbi:hypothetical protein APHAL10511_005175 [Amanita phalloides]|nr:hypothetical protein APHAL10511_005175 [Amanita phalloides]